MAIRHIALALILAATPAMADAPEPLTLTRAAWALTALGEAEAAHPAELLFGDDGRIAGSLGCNRVMGGYIARDDGAFLAGRMASTMMACEEAQMAQEQAGFRAMEAARGWAIEGATLTLTDADGAPVATFEGKARD